MFLISLIVFFISLVLLIYSIALLMGKDGSLFSLFTKKENALSKGQKLLIYIATIVLLLISVIGLLSTL
ncbi:hypothetical protein CW746_08915 [Staphylococcus succinus]|uniref:Preprotein translocase subunit SecG n=1 Tax=Staphylococcus succinus TaxID=61015 RepID=A0ABX5IMC6_9STAP|nr:MULTISPECIES: hypothetical protein [Staphylococcus]MBU0438514.1 hypothetical protein [Staphylococcus succinus]MDH9160687.1 hypothetical protein [Staphylococcus succinus]MEB7462756.1 hypothetical protein [Staphylococcus succinus]OIJ31192.1 hypothetical protein BK821_02100 [Staphylococcus sp. LCT-H4]PKI21485.1 hypothetical protein CW746_08915 [Staphylococcus succinus]